VFVRGYCYSRQLFGREYEPFEWKTNDELRRRYEEPLKVLQPSSGPQGRQKILLEFLRDDEVSEAIGNPFEREKNRVRKLLLGSCKLNDSKMEKNGSYEVTPGVRFIRALNFRKMINSSNAIT